MHSTIAVFQRTLVKTYENGKVAEIFHNLYSETENEDFPKASDRPYAERRRDLEALSASKHKIGVSGYGQLGEKTAQQT